MGSTAAGSSIARISDGGRLVGACMVFYFHVGLYTLAPAYQLGEFAVGFFIGLAGFAYVYFSSRNARPRSYAGYMRTRLSALWPAFALINMVIFLASLLVASGLDRSFTLGELALSVSGLSQYAGSRYLSTVMWFVPFIVQVYLLLPGLERLARRWNPVAFLLGSLGFSLLLVALAFRFLPADAGAICRNWSPLFRLGEVALGLVLARWVLNAGSRAACRFALGLYLGAGIALALAAGGAGFDLCYILRLPLAGLLASAFIVGVAALGAPLFSTPKAGALLRLFGHASYPFFLAHGAGIRTIHGRFGDAPLAWALYFAGCWACSVALILALDAARKLWKSAGEPVRAAQPTGP